MSYSLTQIMVFVIAYLSGLFAVAHLADSGAISRRITHHPAVYVLSLGVFAGAMATNGVIALAQQYGYNFLLYYMGAVVMFAAAALVLMPLLRLCRVYQLASLADVLTFRFRSPWVGAAITIAMCVTLLPLLALQIQAVAGTVNLLAGDSTVVTTGPERHNQLALFFCIIITAFSILFGTRHRSYQERNTGLVTAIAFESVVKLSALLILMFVALYQVFGGFGGLEHWLTDNPHLGRQLRESVDGDVARTLLLVFFAGAVCMPHIFHMAFAENHDSAEMRAATWGLPLYLLLLALPVLPIAWACLKLGHSVPAEFSSLALGLALESTALSALAFVASLSAASATIIVTTLALANMCLTHLVVPFRLPKTAMNQSLYTQLLWGRRILIPVLILGGYSFYSALGNEQQLTELALVAFAGTLHFLPGLIATPYWPKANRLGLLAGLAGGLSIWFIALLMPLISNFQADALHPLFGALSGVTQNAWAAATLVSIFVNSGLFVLVSLVTRTTKSERVAAEICSMDARARPTKQSLAVVRAADFSTQLAPALGAKTAKSEVDLALEELQFSADEDRPYALRRLRARIEANLSGLLGPAAANRIIESGLPFQPGIDDDGDDLYSMERDIDQAQPRFTGLAADLDDLRRHHRETLDKLPIGACSIGANGELLMWNRSMEQITQIEADRVLGSLLGSIPAPWNQILAGFHAADEDTAPKTEVTTNSTVRWISLHKAAIEEGGKGDTIILVEDITDYEVLESELLHSERLASIGRLAAGVAHEIGNPVTGIACLAQNLEYETDPGEIRHMAQDILKQTARVTRIVESLMNFSHTGSSAGEVELLPANLADCVDEAIHLLSLDRDAKPVSFNNHCDRELLVSADSQRLLQVFVNLLGNARDACDEYGEIHIRARADANHINIDVEDNGCGIPAELQQQVFEPFFTTKDPGVGTGLGLSLVYSIMEDMQGKVMVASPILDGPQPGTRVSLQLDRASYGTSFQT
ncbi:MAG: ATP-binding protein [Gammaproteobacteria bacterium]|nr:ATP-binding protein [Gammaproteobacteria bacterium]